MREKIVPAAIKVEAFASELFESELLSTSHLARSPAKPSHTLEDGSSKQNDRSTRSNPSCSWADHR